MSNSSCIFRNHLYFVQGDRGADGPAGASGAQGPPVSTHLENTLCNSNDLLVLYGYNADGDEEF